jgi:cytochrome oxidase Cu insertion factor (SCO1/SenC/PrrC family)
MRARAAFTTIALAFALAASGCGGSTSSTAGSGVEAATPSRFEGAALPGNGVPAPAFALLDQQGHTVSLSSQLGSVVVLAFLYPSCGAPCEVIAQQIRGALDDLGGRLSPRVLIVDADPRAAGNADAGAGRFLHAVGLAGRARYLTGGAAQLLRVLHAYRVPPVTPHAAFARATPVMLLDRTGRERVLYEVEQLTPDSLAHDLRVLMGSPST